jgi:cytosine/adenosine deaminase-related metal-dependent hydrolase
VSRELLIQGGYVVTVDPALGDLPEGDVLVTDDVITAVGTGLHARAPGADVIGARGRLVIPGLVDTHRHVWQGAIGAFTPQITGAGYEPAVLRGIAPLHAPDDIYAGTLWGALQALDAGITTIGDWAAWEPTCSPRCGSRWRPSDPGPTPPPWPGVNGCPRSICTSGTCCGWPPWTARECGISTPRSAA